MFGSGREEIEAHGSIELERERERERERDIIRKADIITLTQK
jgi:hypothetical protein